MVILDTSYIIATIAKEDTFHEVSVQSIDTLNASGEIFIINNFVISELVTLANVRFKKYKETIFNYIEDVLKQSHYDSLYKPLDELHFAKVIKLSKKSNLSFIDCSLIIQALEYKECQILSHDKTLLKVYNSIKDDFGSQFIVMDKGRKKYSAKARKQKTKIKKS